MLRFSALIHRIFGSVNRVSSDTLAHPRAPGFSVLSSFFHRPSSSCPLRLALFLSRSLVTPPLSLFTGPSLFVIPSPSLLLFLVLASFAVLSLSLRLVAFSIFLALARDLLLLSVSLRHFGHCVSVRSRLLWPLVDPLLNSQSFDSSSLRILFLVHRFLILPFSSLLQ